VKCYIQNYWLEDTQKVNCEKMVIIGIFDSGKLLLSLETAAYKDAHCMLKMQVDEIKTGLHGFRH
jgi:hypothetical protein